MDVTVESPFNLNVLSTSIDLPHNGTFVAGRRRRINNDPYGGEGYVWEDITIPDEVGEDTAELSTSETGYQLAGGSTPELVDVPIEQQSVATQRLHQIKGHMIDVLPAPKRMVEGFSLDNIHLGGAGILDWQPPSLSCPRYSATVQLRSFCNSHEWQKYARDMLLTPQNQLSHANHRSENPQDVLSQPWDGLHYRIADQSIHQPRHSFSEIEPLDNPWSSLMAHRRRTIAAIA
jgi:hypothetical protein